MNNNIYKLAKASSHEVRVTFFLLSCTNTIKSSLNYLKPEFFDKSFSEKFFVKYKGFTKKMK